MGATCNHEPQSPQVAAQSDTCQIGGITGGATGHCMGETILVRPGDRGTDLHRQFLGIKGRILHEHLIAGLFHVVGIFIFHGIRTTYNTKE